MKYKEYTIQKALGCIENLPEVVKTTKSSRILHDIAENINNLTEERDVFIMIALNVRTSLKTLSLIVDRFNKDKHMLRLVIEHPRVTLDVLNKWLQRYPYMEDIAIFKYYNLQVWEGVPRLHRIFLPAPQEIWKNSLRETAEDTKKLFSIEGNYNYYKYMTTTTYPPIKYTTSCI